MFSTMFNMVKEIFKEHKDNTQFNQVLNISYWVFLVFYFVGLPIMKINEISMTHAITGEIIDTPWFVYIIGVVIWFVFTAIMILIVWLLILILSGIYSLLKKN